MRWIFLFAWAVSTLAFAATTVLPAVPVDPGEFKFALKAMSASVTGFENPGVLVGFNPQPDPPALPLFLDLGNSLLPALQTPAVGGRTFRFLFGLIDPPEPDSHWRFALTPPPDPDSIAFDVLLDSAMALHVVGHAAISDGGRLDPGSIVGFNPQPDPPGYTAIGFDMSFDPVVVNALALVGDVVLSARIDFQMNGANGSPFAFTTVPLPAPFAMLSGGLGLLGLSELRRKLQRCAP